MGEFETTPTLGAWEMESGYVHKHNTALEDFSSGANHRFAAHKARQYITFFKDLDPLFCFLLTLERDT